MPKSLPNYFLPIKALTSSFARSALHSPNIFRSFPEQIAATKKYFNWLKIIVICFAFVFLLSLTINKIYLLANNREQLKKITLERENIQKEVIYWKNFAAKYNNYADIYLKIASLEYRLNNTQNARIFIDKALSLNPDTEQGRVLGEHIKR